MTIEAGFSLQAFQISGASRGTETLIASSPGYSSAGIPVLVDSGTIDIGVVPTTVTGTVQILLHADGPNFATNFVNAPTTFSLLTSGNLQCVSGGPDGPPISSVTMSGQFSTAVFWLKSFGPGGGSISVSAPGYKTLTTSFNPP